jgi:hypothetical protein
MAIVLAVLGLSTFIKKRCSHRAQTAMAEAMAGSKAVCKNEVLEIEVVHDTGVQPVIGTRPD